jgi:hypothetical protein
VINDAPGTNAASSQDAGDATLRPLATSTQRVTSFQSLLHAAQAALSAGLQLSAPIQLRQLDQQCAYR